MNPPPGVLAARHRAELLFDRAQVIHAIDQLAVRLSVALAELNPLLICVMNGGLPFSAALMQRLHFPLQMSYVHVGRYGDATVGGELEWYAKPDISLEGRHVVFVDDILDRGITLRCLVDWAGVAGADSVRTVVLLDKAVTGSRATLADFTALTCPDRYVFGWGMDFEGYWRNLPDIYFIPQALPGKGR